MHEKFRKSGNKNFTVLYVGDAYGYQYNRIFCCILDALPFAYNVKNKLLFEVERMKANLQLAIFPIGSIIKSKKLIVFT